MAKKIVITESQLKNTLNSIISEQTVSKTPTLLNLITDKKQLTPAVNKLKGLTVKTCNNVMVNGKPCRPGTMVMMNDKLSGMDGTIDFAEVKGWGQAKVTFYKGQASLNLYWD